jgi:protein O-mannosyl-transferase
MWRPIKSSKSRNRPSERAQPRPAAPELLPTLLFWIGAAAVLAGILAVYSPCLSFPFILDDNRFIGDRRIQFPGHMGEYFASGAWAQFAGGPVSFYRPVFLLWVRANFILNETSSWGWHLLSVLKHVSVAVLLGLLVWRLLRNRVAALMGGALFALHPAHTESVAWVTVPDPLMSGAVLGSLLLYLKYRDYPSQRGARLSPGAEEKAGSKKGGRKARKTIPTPARSEPRNARPSVVWLAGSAVLYFAALLVKETAIVALLILLGAALLVRNAGAGVAAGFRSRVLRALRDMPPFVAATVTYFLLRMHALGGRVVAPTQHWPWTTVLLSWPATLWFYVKVLAWPVRFRAFGDPTRADSFSVDGVLLPGLAVCCAVALVAMGLFRGWKRTRRNLSGQEATSAECALVLGALMVVLPLVPALNLNGLNPDDYLHGRYAYLPLAGLMLLAATGWHLAAKGRTLLLVVAGLVVIAFAALTVAQEGAWSSDMSVFTEGQRNAPRNMFVARNLVRAHVQEALGWDVAGRCDEALPVFENAIRQYPEDWYGWAGLGDCLDQLNELPRAEQALHRAADLAHEPRVSERWREVREKLENRTARPGQ